MKRTVICKSIKEYDTIKELIKDQNMQEILYGGYKALNFNAKDSYRPITYMFK